MQTELTELQKQEQELETKIEISPKLNKNIQDTNIKKRYYEILSKE